MPERTLVAGRPDHHHAVTDAQPSVSHRAARTVVDGVTPETECLLEPRDCCRRVFCIEGSVSTPIHSSSYFLIVSDLKISLPVFDRQAMHEADLRYRGPESPSRLYFVGLMYMDFRSSTFLERTNVATAQGCVGFRRAE